MDPILSMAIQQEASTSGAKAQDELWFSPDIEPSYVEPGQTATIRIQYNIDENNIIEITVDGGATFFDLGPATAANTDTVVEIDIDGADKVNVRDGSPGGVNVKYARVSLVA